MPRVQWKPDSDAHDYPAAASYLSLLIDEPAAVDALVSRLREATINHYKAKDLLRAASLPLLPKRNPHVSSDLAKIRKGKALSPALLVRGDLLRGRALQIADGYHRVCASYWTDEDTDIPCRVVAMPGRAGAAVTSKRPDPRKYG